MVTSVRWGVLGAANIARTQLIPAIRRSGAGEVLAVSSASGGARQYAAELDIPRHYASHDDLLADADIDAVYIPLPNTLHVPWIIRAAQAGKHVLCEKPIALSADDLAAAEDACETAGVQLAEAFMYRHHPQLTRAGELVAEGAIGDVVAVDAEFHHNLQRTDPPNIRLRPDLGGGALTDIGCYPVDLLSMLLAGEPQDLTAVAVRDEPGGVDTRLVGSARYGEVAATFRCSLDAAFLARATIIGSEGTLELPDVFRADRTDGRARMRIERPGEEPVAEMVDGDQYGAQALAFAERVVTGEPDLDGAALTRRTTATLERIAHAAGLDWP